MSSINKTARIAGFLYLLLAPLGIFGLLIFGYLFDSFTLFLLPDFGVTIAQYTFIGEILLPLWLLIKGVNVERWEKRAHESA